MMFMKNIKNNISRLPFIIALMAILFSVSITRNIELWKTKQIIQWDVISYYAYLPAAFIYNDLTLNFMDNYNGPHEFTMWPKTAPNGSKVIITSMGMSFMYAPFFLAAHYYALNSDYDAGGYSEPYHLALIISGIFYFALGLFFLCKLLLHFFNPYISSFVVLILAGGTNLFYYGTFEPAVSHVFSFALITMFVWFTIKWYNNQSLGYAIILGILIGLISLIRPTNIIISLFFILYNIRGRKDFLNRVQFFITEYKSILLILIFFFIIWAPQFIYWYKLTGSILYNSYADASRFFFDNPKTLKGFFSYRNGWLIYSPVMIFSVIGLFIARKTNREFFVAILITFLVFIYIVYSWWCWWYGGSFGSRPMVDIYGMLALALGAFFTYITNLRLKALKYSILAIAFVLVVAGVHHINKRRNWSIHWDSMTKEAFWDSYFRTRPSAEFESKLRAPNYENALKGLKEYPENEN